MRGLFFQYVIVPFKQGANSLGNVNLRGMHSDTHNHTNIYLPFE